MFYEVSRDQFAFALYTARCVMDPAKALCVTLPDYDPAARYYVTEDCKAGFCLKPYSLGTDYLCGVFRDPSYPAPVLPHVLAWADTHLGRDLMLDCFAPLARVYEAQGFALEHSVRFDPAFKPEGWDMDTHGTPDVLFMLRPAPVAAPVALPLAA